MLSAAPRGFGTVQVVQARPLIVKAMGAASLFGQVP
jgi:hypothetical protein